MKKLKDIIKKNPEPSKPANTDPGQLGQYADTSLVSESASLDKYLMSRGINPKFVPRDTKIAHSKSTAFLAWQKNHMFEDITTGREKGTDDETRSVAAHSPTLAKANILKKAVKHYEIPNPPGSMKREGSQTPELTPEEVKKPTALDKFRKAAADRDQKHKEIEKRMKERHSQGKENMKSAIDRLSAHMNKEEVSQSKVTKFHSKLDKLVHSTFGKRKNEEIKEANITHAAHFDDPKTGKWASMALLTAKNDEDAVSQAHDLLRTDAYRNYKLSAVEKHEPIKNIKMKEEVEQIDELKKSTLSSYKDKSTASLKNAQANRNAAEPGKNMSKGFADLHAKSDAIAKKRVKGLKGYMQRVGGMKPTSEDVGDAKAAVHADGLPDAAMEPVSERKKQMSKSARMIKALYKKHKMVKEDLYDHEKEDKSVATYGKKPKFDKADKDDSIGEKKPTAAAVMSGGTTLTGEKRDDVEIDPMMRVRPGQPDPFKKDDKKKDDKKDGKKEEKK
jgi:hypothetical protein